MSRVPALPDTPVGRQALWFFGQVLRGSAPAPEEFAAHVEPTALIWTPPLQTDAGWASLKPLVDVGGLGAVNVHSDTSLEITATDERGRSWVYRFAVDAGSGRIQELKLERVHDAEVTVRFATEADSAALADIERRSPMVLDQVAVMIDRGDDYFAAARLMEDVGIALAEVDGLPAGVNCAAVHTVHVGGQPYRLAYYHHLRILPGHQGKGLFAKLGQQLHERFTPPNVDGTYAYVSPDNASSQRLFTMATAWPVQPLRCELAVPELRGPSAGRRATPEDAAEIVEIVNACHENEEFFAPYTVESLSARLERVPAQYTWSDVRIGEGAVLGVWPAGETIRVVVDGPDGRRVEREGLVLDHGFLPGYEAGFEALVRAASAELDDRGFTKLVMFSSAPSPNYPLIGELKATMMPFDMYVFGPPTPADAAQRGVYVDQVYF